jgi:hypothetical protein
MTDLTFAAFAYLRIPLALAGLAFLVGTVGLIRFRGGRSFLAAALMLVLFFQAARLALVVFDPYLSSRPLAEALRKAPRGTLVFNGAYYDFSSVVFYTDQQPLMLNGRINNLEYGSYAPDAPHVFIDNTEFQSLWNQPGRVYIATDMQKRRNLEALVGADHLFSVMHAGGKELITNQPLRTSQENGQS